MTKTSEFLTLLRNYQGLVGTIRQGGVFISFDSIRFNYYADADEIQFLLLGQEGLVSVKKVISYDRLDPNDLLEDAATGYEAVLEDGQTLTFYCFNPRNHS